MWFHGITSEYLAVKLACLGRVTYAAVNRNQSRCVMHHWAIQCHPILSKFHRVLNAAIEWPLRPSTPERHHPQWGFLTNQPEMKKISIFQLCKAARTLDPKSVHFNWKFPSNFIKWKACNTFKMEKTKFDCRKNNANRCWLALQKLSSENDAGREDRKGKAALRP